MAPSLRPVVWTAIVLATLGVGWYIGQAPDPEAANAKPTTPAKYLFLAGGSDPYWQLCIEGARALAAESNAELVVKTPDSEGEAGLQQQTEWLTDLDANGYDGVAIGPIDPARQTPLINSVAEKMTVITVDSDAPSSRRMFYIGSSNLEAGMIAADKMKAAMPQGGKVAVLMASEAKTNAVERKQGIQDGLERSDADSEGISTYEIVDFYLDGGDLQKCRDNVAQALEDHDDLGAIMGTFGYHGPIILDVLGESNRDISVIAFDEAPRTLDAVEDGRIYATVVQDPFMFGAEAVQMLQNVRNGRFLSLPVSNGAVGVHCRAITKENLAEFRGQLDKRLATTERQQ